MKLRLAVSPEFCLGQFPRDTISLIKLIYTDGNLGLAEAKSYVDAAINTGEMIDIPLSSKVNGQELLRKIQSLDTTAETSVELVD